jgi:hypothetical protein
MIALINYSCQQPDQELPTRLHERNYFTVNRRVVLPDWVSIVVGTDLFIGSEWVRVNSLTIHVEPDPAHTWIELDCNFTVPWIFAKSHYERLLREGWVYAGGNTDDIREDQ